MSPASQGPLRLRVTVADAWKTVALEAAQAESAGSLKVRALALAHIAAAAAGAYQLKVGGALVRDESKPLAALVKSGAAVVVVPLRRRPVR